MNKKHMPPVALKSCQFLTLFGEMCLEIHLGFESQVRRHWVRGPESCHQSHKQPAGGRLKGEKEGIFLLPRRAEAQLCSQPPSQSPLHGGGSRWGLRTSFPARPPSLPDTCAHLEAFS